MLVFWRGAVQCRVECQAHEPSHAWQPNNEISGHPLGAASPHHVDGRKYCNGASEANETGKQAKWSTNRAGFLMDCSGCDHRIPVSEAYLANAPWSYAITHGSSDGLVMLPAWEWLADATAAASDKEKAENPFPGKALHRRIHVTYELASHIHPRGR
jgi:hypothetical protein